MSSDRAFKIPFAIAFFSLILMSIGACTKPTNNLPTEPTNPQNQLQAKKSKKLILTTFTVLADMTQNVAGDKAIVESLIKSGSEIHGYEPTPSDLVRGKQADLILDNGLGLERWAAKYYANLSKVPRVTLSEGIKPVNIAEDAYQGKPNPHAWMSPQNALIYVDNIREALIKIDPVNTESYNQNANIYSQKIRDIDQKLKQEVSVIPESKRYMVSCEGAFTYLTRDYGLKEVYLWPVNSEQQATPQRTKKVIETVKNNNIPVVFCESTVNPEVQKQVAKEANSKFGGVFYVDSLSPSTGPAATYLKLLDYNITTLIKGLQSQS
ncbi:iron-binding protein [Oscillatoriales cyanobacterium USR001]|nr:iron-binding protein [Oscillatoriales cyanobacterium USR001]